MRYVIIVARKYDVRTGDRLFQLFVASAAFAGLGLLAACFYEIYTLSKPALEAFGFGLIFKNAWDPIQNEYGILAFVYGTVVTSFLAVMIATPISVAAAAFLSELAPYYLKKSVAFLIEMLAAIPSVVYGLWGIFVLAPFLRTTGEPFLANTLGFLPFFQGAPYGVGMLAAGLILAIMITPTIASLTREIFETVPRSQREAALALGATRWESIKLGVLKSAIPGILGAVILGLGRALGETMAVTMLIGNRNDISISLFDPAQTMASVLANEYNEASGLHLSALASVGLALFVVSFFTNVIARLIVWRSR